MGLCRRPLSGGACVRSPGCRELQSGRAPGLPRTRRCDHHVGFSLIGAEVNYTDLSFPRSESLKVNSLARDVSRWQALLGASAGVTWEVSQRGTGAPGGHQRSFRRKCLGEPSGRPPGPPAFFVETSWWWVQFRSAWSSVRALCHGSFAAVDSAGAIHVVPDTKCVHVKSGLPLLRRGPLPRVSRCRVCPVSLGPISLGRYWLHSSIFLGNRFIDV